MIANHDWQRATLAVFARTGDEFSYLKNLQWYLRMPFEEAQRRARALEESGYLESRPEKFGPTFRISESGRKFLEEAR